MFTLIVIVLSLLLIIWLFVKNKFSYWKNRGIPYMEPIIPYGNLKSIGKTRSMKDFFKEAYEKYKNVTPFLGVYFFFEPVAVIFDLNLIRNILVKDFSYFQDRKLYYNEQIEPLSAHLFNLHGEKWRLARQKLSPTFTSGRLKNMFPMIVEISERFIDLLNPVVEEGHLVEIQDLLTRYTIDVSGTIIYGIECNSMKDPNTEFREKGRHVFNDPRNGEMTRLFMDSFPRVASFFGMKLFPDDVNEFFMNIIQKTIEYRETNNIFRNDFMDLLIQLKNTGTLVGHDGEIGRLTPAEIAAQALIFFVGGFETTSSTIGFVLYQLCLHQDIQDRVRTEIGRILDDHNDKFSYDAMMEMKYLHRVVDETLRIFPQAPYLFRKVDRDYRIPGTNHILEKDTAVMIPTVGFGYDPSIFPNPDKFDPDNFLPEHVAERDPFVYMPFGEGPRNCIGSRLGKIMTYVGVVTLLQKYRFKPSEKTPVPLKFEPDVIVLKPTTDYFFKIEKIIKLSEN